MDRVVTRERMLHLDVWLSYGVSDRQSAVCAVELVVPEVVAQASCPTTNRIHTAPLYAVCRLRTFKKTSTAHSSQLADVEKATVTPGTRFRVVGVGVGDHCDHLSLQEEADPDAHQWFVYTAHFLVY